jgi:lysophospholipase L1-like esterase
VPLSCRLGVLALGDSITNGHGGMQSGLGSQSWAQWLAQALGLPFTKLAKDGATAADVVRDQLPAIPGERYDVGCIYVGANDVRNLDWDAAAYERDLATIVGALAARCDRVLALTIPRDLGLPPAGAKVEQANAAVERVAAEHAASVVDLRDFTGARWVWADRVHATATGQVEIADRAARVLGAARLPSQVAEPPDPDLLYRWHYARRTLREQARAALARRRASTT